MKQATRLFLMLAFTMSMFAAVNAQTSIAKLGGGSVDVQGQRGKVVILAVGASWLPLSNKQVEFAMALAKKYQGRDVVVYFVATDSTNAKSKNFANDDAIRNFASSAKMTLPVLRDSDGAAIAKTFRVDQLPSFVIIDKQGNKVGEPFGGLDPKYDITIPISKAVDQLL